MIVMRILHLVNSRSSPHDGKYLKEYIPGTGVGGQGLVTTSNKEEAYAFKTPEDAFALWKSVDPRMPIRHDGKPNRPLTAFTVVIETV